MKKMKIFVQCLICVICLSAICACCKDKIKECDKPWFVEVEEPLKHYLFSPGSYWVYKYENAGTEDSIVLQTLKDTLYNYPIFPPIDTVYQMCFFTYKDITRNTFYSEELYWNIIIRADNYEINGGQGMFVYNEVPYTAPGFTYIELIPSISINGVNYFNVRHFKNKGTSAYQSSFKFDTETYYSPDVGLIKWIEHDTVNGDQTYSLLRYYRIPYNLIERCYEI